MGEEQGKIFGHMDGYDDGYVEGYNKGINVGYKKAIDEIQKSENSDDDQETGDDSNVIFVEAKIE